MRKIRRMEWSRTARSILIAVAAMSFALPAHAQTPTPTEIAKPAAPPQKEAEGPPPIAFFIAKGEADACGPGCAEWIAADGMIDAGAPQRLRAPLARAGKRTLSVYFHSSGGFVVRAVDVV